MFKYVYVYPEQTLLCYMSCYLKKKKIIIKTFFNIFETSLMDICYNILIKATSIATRLFKS